MKTPLFIAGSLRRGFFLVPAVVLLSPSFVIAALTDVAWDGPANGAFNTAANWSTDTNPGTGNRAVIDTGVSGGSPVWVTNSPTLGGLSIAAGNQLTRSTSATGANILTLGAATSADTYFSNAGTLSSGGASGSLTITHNGAAASTFANSGIIEATAGSTLTLSKGQSAPGLNNTGGTLRTVGTGTLEFGGGGNSSWSITGGAISNVSTGTLNFLIRNPFTLTDVAFTNAGTANFLEPALTNSGGYGIKLAGTSSLNNSGTINLTREPTKNVNIGAQSAVISSAVNTTSITNSGTINIATIGDSATSGSGGSGFSFTGSTEQTLTNTGTINLESRSTTHGVVFSVSTTNTGSLMIDGNNGVIVMKVGVGGDVARVMFGGSNGVITQNAGHTIRGAGNIGANEIKTFTNNGTVLADDATYALTLDPRIHTQMDTGVGSFINNGTVRATGAGGLILNDGKHVNNGLFQINAGSSLTQNAGMLLTNNAGKILDIKGAWSSGTGGGGLITNAGDVRYDSAINSVTTIGLTGAGNFTKEGTGSLTMNGANTSTGNTVINGGTLTVGAGTGNTFTATLINGNFNVTTTDTAGLVVGQVLTGTGMASGARITGIISATQFTMSRNAASNQASTSLSTADYSALGSGAVTINGGTLVLGTGTHTVSSVALGAGTLAGTGTLNGLVTTGGTSGTISAGNSPGTLTLATGLNAAAGVSFDFELGTSPDLLSLGSFTGSTAAGGLLFNFSNSGGLAAGVVYTLIDFNSATGLDYTDFATGSIASGFILDGSFGTGGWMINGDSVQVQFAAAVPVPEPSTYAGLAGVCVGLAAALRRRRPV